MNQLTVLAPIAAVAGRTRAALAERRGAAPTAVEAVAVADRLAGGRRRRPQTVGQARHEDASRGRGTGAAAAAAAAAQPFTRLTRDGDSVAVAEGAARRRYRRTHANGRTAANGRFTALTGHALTCTSCE